MPSCGAPVHSLLSQLKASGAGDRVKQLQTDRLQRDRTGWFIIIVIIIIIIVISSDYHLDSRFPLSAALVPFLF